MAKILVVDDEAGIREMLSDALSLIRLEPADLVIADINMPKLDGFQLLQRLREQGNDVPVLMLTARQERGDVTHGLRLGADDYVTKPFGLEELILRVNAILRRTGKLGDGPAPKLQVGPVTLDDDSHQVLLNGNLIDLSPTEFKLLRYLMTQPRKVVKKETLLDAIWGYGFATGATVVDTYISYLRKKLHTAAWQGIRTVRGIGFMISDENLQSAQ